MGKNKKNKIYPVGQFITEEQGLYFIHAGEQKTLIADCSSEDKAKELAKIFNENIQNKNWK